MVAYGAVERASERAWGVARVLVLGEPLFDTVRVVGVTAGESQELLPFVDGEEAHPTLAVRVLGAAATEGGQGVGGHSLALVVLV